jgi:hypothetical protein
MKKVQMPRSFPFLPPINPLLIAIWLIGTASVVCADDFSFDKALSIYNNTSTAHQLSTYLGTASPNDRKDYRFALYQIRGDYANFRFFDGDGRITEALGSAKSAGLTDAQIDGIKADLAKERSFWVEHIPPTPSIVSTIGHSETSTGDLPPRETDSKPATVHTGGSSTSRQVDQ